SLAVAMELAAGGMTGEEAPNLGAGVSDVHHDREVELGRQVELGCERALLHRTRRATAGQVHADLADGDDVLVRGERTELREGPPSWPQIASAVVGMYGHSRWATSRSASRPAYRAAATGAAFAGSLASCHGCVTW